jgi:hypothetical protein
LRVSERVIGEFGSNFHTLRHWRIQLSYADCIESPTSDFPTSLNVVADFARGIFAVMTSIFATSARVMMAFGLNVPSL